MACSSAQASNIDLLVEKLCLSLEKSEISKSVLKAAIPYDDLTEYIPTASANSYTFKKRISLDTLIENFTMSVTTAQRAYIQKVNEELETIKLNFNMCQMMDEKFGEIIDEEDIDETVDALKDGTRRLKCIIGNCGTNTFKLRRHFDTMHKEYSDESKEFALKMARTIAGNKKPACTVSVKNISPPKRIGGNTNLVSRKYNYKICMLCDSLYMNMSDHVSKYHKITKSDPRYKEYVEMCTVVPKVFTKVENKHRVLLSGEELENAKLQYSENVESQTFILNNLKDLRSIVETLKVQMKDAESKEKYEDLKKELTAAQEEYYEYRYKDSRVYSEQMNAWKESYTKYLKNKQFKQIKRKVKMALDVCITFEAKCSLKLTFQDLVNIKTLRNILITFREESKISFTSKAKYLSQFKQLLLFLILDAESPEQMHLTDMSDSFKIEQVKHEIQNELDILNKLKANEVIATKSNAEKKLLSEEEIDVLMLDVKNYLQTVQDEFKKEERKNFSKADTLKIRNALIAVATVRLGRRSLEMTKMTLEEVQEAKKSTVDGVDFYTINVAEQKNKRSGQPSPVVYDSVEFEVLKYFIQNLRSQLTDDKFCKIVFPAAQKVNSHADQTLGLSAAFKILQKFQSSGKQISSRSIRGSKITISRRKNLSDSVYNHMADVMSHKRSTADGYYAFQGLEESVKQTLKSQTMYSSTPIKASENQTTQNTTLKRKLDFTDDSTTLEDLSLDFSSEKTENTSTSNKKQK